LTAFKIGCLRLSEEKTFRLQLRPTHAELTVALGTSLRDALFEQGVEFPCGGQGRCRGCRVRVLEGVAEVNAPQRERLSAEELAGGWRLACQCAVESDLVIELRQWDAAILVDDTVFSFEPREGLGVAVDLGTTTLVAQLLDLRSGRVLAVRTALNAQARHGADVMSRVQFAAMEGGQRQLQEIIRRQIGALIEQLLFAANLACAEVSDIVIVGNTVMHHLFCGFDVESLSHYPFETEHGGPAVLAARDLGWRLAGTPTVRFLPCLGSFVGSDVLAGVLATKLGESQSVQGLVDLGTNGEIVIGNRERMLCASTAAGPAFEGARISMGMRAASGAISEVSAGRGGLHCRVVGNVAPIGLCGSGLVDAVATGLDLEVIAPSGRFAGDNTQWTLAAPVVLTQSDIRELQLAKAAIAAGLRILLERWGNPELRRLYLAGAFGNYINRTSARRIGLIDLPPEKVEAAGNTALLGAKLALFNPDGEGGPFSQLRRKIEHVALNADPHFEDVFVEELTFPQGAHALD
jgi:uncharacterized 2Fe-2S/4Fe-4S cluster protein (DUF4445 family)